MHSSTGIDNGMERSGRSSIRKKTGMKRLVLATVVAVALLTASTASAASITFNLGHKFGSGTPSGVISATFEDLVDGVLLTMDATNLTGGEHVKDWVFNFSGDSTTLDFAYQSGVQAPSVTKKVKGVDTVFDPPVLDPNNVDTLAPAKGFDIGFAFWNSSSASGIPNVVRFGPTAVAGDPSLSVYKITAATPITAAMFNVALSDASYPFYSAAHIGALANGDSAKQADNDSPNEDNDTPVPVPEPGSAAAAIFGLGALGLAGRFVRK
jgi:hypothetical protein